MVNTSAPGDKLLMFESSHFAMMWSKLARNFGLEPEVIERDWRGGAEPDRIEDRLLSDNAHEIKSVCVVHNETLTGSVSPIAGVRAAIDTAGQPSLLMVDSISGLASIDCRFDEWWVDGCGSGSQKGLMLPPGLEFNAVSTRAMERVRAETLPRSYWDSHDLVGPNQAGYFPYTPGTNLLYGLNEAIAMLLEEGFKKVFDLQHLRPAPTACHPCRDHRE